MTTLVRFGHTQNDTAREHGGRVAFDSRAGARAIGGSIAALGLVLCVTLAHGADRSGPSVPWEVVAELLPDPGGPRTDPSPPSRAPTLVPSSNGDPAETARNYAFPPDRPALLELPRGSRNSEAEVQMQATLALWTASGWRAAGRIPVNAAAHRIITCRPVGQEGLYKLILAPEPSDGCPPIEASFIVTGNWKPDLLAHCRRTRDQIELEADPEMIRASIAVSHWDRVMELAAPASVLSDDLLHALRDAVRATVAFRAGVCPDLVTGLTKARLRRFPGARLEEFTVCVPNEYTSTRKWPVFLHSDNQRWSIRDKFNKRSGLIDVWWHTVTDKDIDWKTYDAIWSLLRQKLNVDEDRVYVTGDCRHGLAAMSLALTRPDRWAECSVSLANTYRHMAGNALNLRMVYARGTYREEGWATGSYDFAVKCFRRFGCEHLVASDSVETDQARGRLVPDATRIKAPPRIALSIESLDNGQAYWARIDGREDENSLGRLNVSILDREIRVDTDNVDAYTLFLENAPLDGDPEVHIVENGTPLGHTRDKVFTRRSPKYDGTAAVKHGRLHGPIWDAFTDRYAVLWGGGSRGRTDSGPNQSVAEALAKGAPCLAGTTAPEDLIRTHNLVLVGAPAQSHWSARLADALPLEVESSRITMLGREFRGTNLGVILIHPNPLNPEKYVVVFAGTSPLAMQHMDRAYTQLRSLRPVDVALFEVDAKGAIRWHVFEKLNTVWGWHDTWDQVLMRVDKVHPPWQWRQWVSNMLKQHYEADVAICENPLWFDDAVPVGAVTYRQMANTLQDHWLVKVRISGKELRQLLMAPFTGTAAQEVNKPSIAGIRLFKTSPQQERLSVHQLENDRMYLLVCNYKCLNGTRMGQRVKAYEIMEDGYLLNALRDHLSGLDTDRNIDAQLDSLKVEIY